MRKKVLAKVFKEFLKYKKVLEKGKGFGLEKAKGFELLFRNLQKIPAK